jgi:hypothetical protein
MEVLALSELEGTPMMAAPSRAAAAVTASRAVLMFTGPFSVNRAGHEGAHRLGNACPHTIAVALRVD